MTPRTRTSPWLLAAPVLLLLAAGVGLLQAGTQDAPAGDAHAGAANATRPVSAELVQAYNQPGSLRDFVRHALARPEAGGAFYATQVLRRCRTLQATAAPAPEAGATAAAASLSTPAASEQARTAAAATLRQRCAGLSPDDLAEARIAQAAADGMERGDPLLAMALRAGKAAYQAPERRRSLLFDLLAAGDPLLIQDVALRIAVQADPDTGVRGHRFEGVFHPQSLDDSVELALYLLPCGLGLDCTRATDWDLLLRCANGFECAASREDYVAAVLRGRPGAHERTLAIYQRMLAAVRTGQVAVFM